MFLLLRIIYNLRTLPVVVVLVVLGLYRIGARTGRIR